ncbi:GNAT family N-acetyltransferase [Leifsonia shinshuensis]|uniref:RimJ/RimL family protein N-acetyltransferase n=1 Tax=Leifsonia shinshuensis TaxID=150026 RepID=A0A853D125_9MICO|nr:GNAT family N-acetyltransferase [Leifsonia shinshuensis]NYJ25124.1 RimJ/RimL family protein N-acetyltransferase [Leifsonia shinshuensis]
MAPAPVELAGGPVVLSAPVEADIDRIAEFCRDPEIAAWTTVPSPYERADAEKFVAGIVPDGWASGRECTWALRDAQTRLLHGMIGLHHLHDGEGEIGFWLSAGARGRGWMAAAVDVVLDYAFDASAGLGLQRVVWHAFAGNAASAAVARRAGFQWEGVARLGAPHRGVRRDDWQAALLPGDPRQPADGWPAFTSAQAAR